MKGLLELIAKRYIAGRTIEDAVRAARELNGFKLSAIIDNLGENVRSPKEAEGTVGEYSALLDAIRKENIDSTVSLKLTHLGLDISEDLAKKNAEAIIKKAVEDKNLVWFDMEGSAYTQRTIDIFLELKKKYPNVGIAIQTALLRSAADIKTLIENNAGVRLVKGAYKEPAQTAFQEKKDVDANFSKLMKELLLKGNHPAIATHDEKLIKEAIAFAKENNIPKERFEFQMLLGIKRGLQKKLAEEGYHVGVYIPYGTNWLPYTMRRLRERKENIYFVVRNMFD